MAITPGQIDEMTYQSQILKKGRMGFSGCDITAMIRLPAYKSGRQVFNEEKVFQIGTLQTLSISTYNAKSPVKAVGFKNPIAVARGGRTIAGTLIFNQMHHHVFDENNWQSMTTIKDDGFLTYSSGNVDYFRPNSKLSVSDTATQEQTDQKVKEFLDSAIDKEKLKKQWDFSWDTSLMGERSKPSDMPPFDIVILMVNELGQVGKIVLYGVDIVHDSQTLSVEDIYTEAQYQYVARDIEYFHAANFEESFAWKASTPDFTIIASKQVTGTDISEYNTGASWSMFGTGEEGGFSDDPSMGAMHGPSLEGGYSDYPMGPMYGPSLEGGYNENPAMGRMNGPTMDGGMSFGGNQEANARIHWVRHLPPQIIPRFIPPDPGALRGPRRLRPWNASVALPAETITGTYRGYNFTEAEGYDASQLPPFFFTDAEGYDASQTAPFFFTEEESQMDMVKDQMRQNARTLSLGGFGSFTPPEREEYGVPQKGTKP
jgi:hypothetical protein